MKYLVKAFLLIFGKAISYSFGLMSFAADLAINAVYDLLKLGVTKLAASIMKHSKKDPADQTMPNASSALLPDLYSCHSSPPVIIVVIVMKQAS